MRAARRAGRYEPNSLCRLKDTKCDTHLPLQSRKKVNFVLSKMFESATIERRKKHESHLVIQKGTC